MKKLTLLLFLLPLWICAQNPEDFSEEVIEIQQRVDSILDTTKPVIVFTGSSSVRLWEDLQERFPEHQILNTGFGGSQSSDLEKHLNSLVLKYNPVRVFIYEGDNDINAGKRPKSILETMERIVETIQNQPSNPDIVLISAKPSISRWRLRGKYRRLNRKLDKFAESMEKVYFADVWHPMLDGKKLKRNLFISDGLHMNKMGYDIWSDVLKDFVNEVQ